MVSAVKQCTAKELTRKGGHLPAKVSIRDLCDCGRHKNYPITPPDGQERKPLEKDTNYSLTYKPIKDARPRSSKRPLPDLPDLRKIPMTFDTNQRHDYKNLGVVDRVQPCIHSDNYEPANEPVQSNTWYRSEFTAKNVLPEIRRVDPSGETMKQSKGDKFATETTNKDHYKQWVSQPAISFRDLPTFTGSVLFPDKDLQCKTTFQTSFLGEYNPPAEMAKSGKVINLKNEGMMEMGTTNQSVFKHHEGDHRAHKVDRKAALSEINRSRFHGETQNMKDFGTYRKQATQRAVKPPPTTIQLAFDDQNNFSTEQRSIYKGHDTVKHPVVKSCKQENADYERPTEKIASVTSQKHDYQPIDMSQVTRTKISRYDQDKLQVGGTSLPFESTTTNKLFYKDWGTGERIRFGDYHDRNTYVPPSLPMQGETTTKRTYTVKKAERSEQFIPEENLGKRDGSHCFDTEYNREYKEQEFHVCPAQRFILEKEMKKNLAAPEIRTQGIIVN